MASSDRPLQSRKFVAYLTAEITWKGLAALVLFWGKDSIPTQVWLILLAIIVVAGFVEVAYISGQAGLDRYTQVAQIAARSGQSVMMKGITIQPSGNGHASLNGGAEKPKGLEESK
jgi:hypothetical protein